MAESIVIYCYNPLTGEFLGTGIARRSPLDADEIFLIPAHATDIAPPVIQSEQVAVFRNGAWAVIPDFRGQTWFDAGTGKEVIVDDLDTPVGLIRELSPELTAKKEADAVASAWAELRRVRDTLLLATDPCFRPDYPFVDTTEEERPAAAQSVLVYSRALRDLPENTPDPRQVIWPERPACLPPSPIEIPVSL